MTRGFRRGDPFCRVGFQTALTDQPVEETAQGREPERQARRAEIFFTATHDEPAYRGGVTLLPAFQADFIGNLHDGIKLTLIVEQRNRAELAFYAQIAQKAVDVSGEQSVRHTRSIQRSSSSGSIRAISCNSCVPCPC